MSGKAERSGSYDWFGYPAEGGHAMRKFEANIMLGLMDESWLASKTGAEIRPHHGADVSIATMAIAFSGYAKTQIGR